jgi:hypothetical protein
VPTAAYVTRVLYVDARLRYSRKFSRPTKLPQLLRYPLAILAAVFLLVTGVAAGCGGGSDSSGEDINKVLDQTFNRDNKVDSGKLGIEGSAKLEGIKQITGPITVSVSGPFEGLEEKVKDTGQLPRTDFEMTANAGGQKISAGSTSTGSKLYVNFQGNDYVVPDNVFERFKRQLENAQAQSDKSKQPDLGALGIEPQKWLVDAKDEGTEDVGGVETIHISAGVDVPRLLDDFNRLLSRAGELGLSAQQRQQLPASIPDSVKKQIISSVKDAKLDVYTGKDDKVLRKLDLDLKFEVPENLRQQAQGLQRGDIKFTYQVKELNKPQTVEPPKSARPLSELQRQFSGTGLGSLGSSGSSSGGGTTGSSSTSSPKSRRYLRCVEKAQGTAELRQCASILR